MVHKSKTKAEIKRMIQEDKALMNLAVKYIAEDFKDYAGMTREAFKEKLRKKTKEEKERKKHEDKRPSAMIGEMEVRF